MTTEDFKKRAIEKHGDKYDYSKTIYITGHSKVIIICKEHGEFLQDPQSHLTGRGCYKCYSSDIRGSSQRYNKEIFIEKAKQKHGDKYDYSKVEYKNSQTKVIIICKEHGEFLQIANSHLIGYGCQLCAAKINGDKMKLTNEQFINKAKNKHGKLYDYSLMEYVNEYEKVKIICKNHGIFEQSPTSHLNGRGCPLCITSIGENKIRVFLEKNNIEFEEQKKFETCKYKSYLRFDFYLIKYNLLIEFDGIQHFPEGKILQENYKYKFGHNFEQIQKRDEFKNNWCKENNMKLLRIKYDQDPENVISKYLENIHENN